MKQLEYVPYVVKQYEIHRLTMKYFCPSKLTLNLKRLFYFYFRQNLGKIETRNAIPPGNSVKSANSVKLEYQTF